MSFGVDVHWVDYGDLGDEHTHRKSDGKGRGRSRVGNGVLEGSTNVLNSPSITGRTITSSTHESTT